VRLVNKKGAIERHPLRHRAVLASRSILALAMRRGKKRPGSEAANDICPVVADHNALAAVLTSICARQAPMRVEAEARQLGQTAPLVVDQVLHLRRIASP
jgi:hypothetical protein